jgi:Kef-type K+ transport system membrane component KefB
MAWILLACVIAATRGSFSIALLAAGGGLAYTAIMVFAARPALRSWERIAYGDDGVRPEALALVIALLMACAWITDAIGIYSVFGAFMAGIAMPRGRFAEGVKRSLEPISTTLLVPIFFAYSGLNTRLDLLTGTSVLVIAAATIVVAFVCKGAGCALACRWAGATWRDSAALGILMNARGLMELVLANIALERGLITPSMFTILVLMAIVTTLAATPLYHWLRPSDWEAMPSAAEEKPKSVLEHGSQ